MKLGIGTVQFGMDYGISNRHGQTPIEEVKRILNLAASNEIRVLDTAALYGVSEKVLGIALEMLAGGDQFDIVTKTPAFGGSSILPDDAIRLEGVFLQSLQNLKLPHVYGLLAHSANDLLVEGGELLMEKMQHLKQRGLVKKVGASVYTGEQIDKLVGKYSLDMIQLPFNVLDQRLLADGSLARLKHSGIEVHTRSAFLQGVLLMDVDKLPVHFDSVKAHLHRYHAHLIRSGLSRVEGALGFAMHQEHIDIVVCGINTCLQLEELLAALRPELDGVSLAMQEFATFDPLILNPSQWPKCS